jgi:hypothetical protein
MLELDREMISQREVDRLQDFVRGEFKTPAKACAALIVLIYELYEGNGYSHEEIVEAVTAAMESVSHVKPN